MNYIWPVEDDAYMKIILKEFPDGRMMRIIGSRLLPVGDFDSPDSRVPEEPVRVYKTRNGFRVFFISRDNEPPGSFLESLVPLGMDRRYWWACRDRGYYACRIDPKAEAEIFGVPAVTQFLYQIGEPVEAWRRFISTHDEMTGAMVQGSVLV